MMDQNNRINVRPAKRKNSDHMEIEENEENENEAEEGDAEYDGKAE